MPPVNAATEEMNKIRLDPRFPHGARRALGEQERGAQVHRQHLIGLGGGDVLQRLEMTQPGVAGRRAGACPVPPLAPVISATRPLNGPSMPAGLSHRMAGPMARGGRKAPAVR